MTAAGPAKAEDCGALKDVKLLKGEITAAEIVPAFSPGAPATASAPMPAYCRVRAVSKPSPDSDIRFELWIPLDGAWNGKYEQMGNGGFAGEIPAAAMARALSLGYAVAGTDDGHQSADNTDASFALDHDEKIRDYGWRAIRDTRLGSQRILKKFKAKPAAKAYFVGCSDGGREALMMAQRFPNYFDGIVAGAPAYAMSRLLTSGALKLAQLTSPAGRLSAADLMLLQNSALARCGGGAAYLKDPRSCQADPAALKCEAGQTQTCLTDAQIATAETIYRQERDPVKGDVLYAVLPGAEAAKGGWDAWLTGSAGFVPIGVRFTSSYLAYMVMRDPTYDPAKVTQGDVARAELHYGALMDATDPDLSAFRAHGGKLIQYHGWNDPGIAPGYSLEYRARVAATMGSLGDFYRLYMIPGMLHCGGGNAPTAVDWQATIEAWVERGVAPGALTAHGAQGLTQTVSPFVAATSADAR